MSTEKKIYLTKKGLEKIKKEYQDLKNLKLAKSKGDFSEVLHSEDVNPEYLSFQEDLNFLEARLFEIKDILKNVELIKLPSKEKRNIVNLGAQVTLEESDGGINEFLIVGSLEANPNEGKISSESPVGKALLEHRIGDEVIITSPIKVIYRIKKIKYQSL